jgi:hypothetical protein
MSEGPKRVVSTCSAPNLINPLLPRKKGNVAKPGLSLEKHYFVRVSGAVASWWHMFVTATGNRHRLAA